MAFLFLVSLVLLGVGIRAAVKGSWPRIGLSDRSRSFLVAGIGGLLFAAAIALPPAGTELADTKASDSRSTSRRLGNDTRISASPSPSPPPSPMPSPSPSPAKPPEPSTAVPVIAANVTKIVDGDTAQMSLSDGRNEKVRFIGMDTPEVGKPHAGEATSYTSQMISDKQVWLEIGTGERDRYGRLLAYVWLAPPKRADDAEARSLMLNAKLLLDGYAQLMTVPPNVKYVDQFRAYQEEARTGDRGLWGITTSPPSAPDPPPAPPSGGNCDPSYPDVCIPSPPPDLNCGDISHRHFKVLEPDPHRFDGNDNDGIGCES